MLNKCTIWTQWSRCIAQLSSILSIASIFCVHRRVHNENPEYRKINLINHYTPLLNIQIQSSKCHQTSPAAFGRRYVSLNINLSVSQALYFLIIITTYFYRIPYVRWVEWHSRMSEIY